MKKLGHTVIEGGLSSFGPNYIFSSHLSLLFVTKHADHKFF